MSITVLSTMFKDEVLELKRAIHCLKIENCIENYSNYLESNKIEGPFEKRFVANLNKRGSNFITGLLIHKMDNLSREEIVKELFNVYRDGTYCIEDNLSNDGYLETFRTNNFNDGDVFEAIKFEMLTVLEDLIVETNRTSEEERIADAKKIIEDRKDRIKRCRESITTAEKEIADLQESLK